jgi:hypothetical protein
MQNAMIAIISWRNSRNYALEPNMGEVIQFVSRSERERLRLIREARAIYDSIFPPADQDVAAGGGNGHRSDGGKSS